MTPLRRLRRLKLDRVDLVGAGANPGAYVALHKSDEPRTNETGETIETMSETSVEVEAVEAVEPVAEVTVEPVAEIEPAAEPELVAASRETVTKAEHDAVVEQLAKMQENAELREFTDIAKSELGSLPEKPEAMGALLRKCKSALSESEYQSLFRLLKAANAQTDTSALFAQYGNPTETDAVSVEDQVTAKAKELVESGGAATIEQATLKVLTDSPELRKAIGAQKGI